VTSFTSLATYSLASTLSSLTKKSFGFSAVSVLHRARDHDMCDNPRSKRSKCEHDTVVKGASTRPREQNDAHNDDHPKFKHEFFCPVSIRRDILGAQEDEVCDIEVEDYVLCDLDSLNNALTALSSSACPPDLKTASTVLKK
jgi:hypothetical protein